MRRFSQIVATVLLLTSTIIGGVTVHRYGWSTKPPEGVQINWGHPLADRLQGVWLFNDAFQNRVTASGVRSINGALSLVSSPYDLAFSCGTPNANSFTFNRAASDRVSLSSSPITVLAVVNPTDVSVANGTIFNIGEIDNNNFNFSFGLDQTVVNGKMGIGNAGGPNTIDSPTLVFTAGKWSFAGVSQAGNASRFFFLDGSWENSTASMGGGSATGPGSVGITYSNQAPAIGWRGTIAAVWYWDRALSVTEVQQFYADPYRILGPQMGHVRWYTTVVAGTVLRDPIPGRGVVPFPR